MNILLSLILACFVLFLLFLAYSVYKIIKFISLLKEFTSPGDDKTPSPLALLTQSISEMVARSIVAQAKATFMGKQSGQARGEAAVEGAILEDEVGAINPLLAGLLTSFPSLGKTLRKNPALVDFALSKLATMKGGQPKVDNAGNGNQPKFNL